MRGIEREAEARAIAARHEEKEGELRRARGWATGLLLLLTLVYVLATALGGQSSCE